MDDRLYDTSWTLYFVSNAKSSYQDLVAADQHALDRRAKQFRDFVNINKPKYDSDSENERTGGLRDCTWKTLPNPSSGMLVCLIYDKATYKFVLSGSAGTHPLSLLLAKGPATTVKRFTNFLTDTFHASVDPLRLPTSLLQNVVEGYFKTLSSTDIGESSPLDRSTVSPASQLLKNTIGNLKVTVTFSAPVAPQLKTLDLDIPADTVSQFLETTQKRSNTRSSPKSLLALVAHHLQNTTGLKIPIVTSETQLNGTNREAQEENTVMRISKITCAAFAISVDGRLKFASKAVEASVQYEDTVSKANVDILRRVEEEATRRSTDG